MGFKWIDKTANDPVSENDINAIGQAVEALFEEVENGGGGGGNVPEGTIPTKLSELENDAGFITANDLPFKVEDYTMTIDSLDFINIDAYDVMSLSARNGLNLSVENDMYLSASNISVSGDMHVQAPQSNDSVVTKKYVDDAIAALKALLNLQ